MSDARRRASSEVAIQRDMFQHLRLRGVPGVFAFHPANGGYRKPIEAAILKACGVVAGLPDVICICQSKIYALELKAEGGRATPERLDAVAAMEAAGAHCCFAEGLDRKAWGLLRGRAIGGAP
jgi:hypothetical protein